MPYEFPGIKLPRPSLGDVPGHVLARPLPVAELVRLSVGVRVVEQERILPFQIVLVVNFRALVSPLLGYSGKLGIPLLEKTQGKSK